MRIWLLGLGLLSACPASDEEDDPGLGGDDCPFTALSVSPADGSTGIFIDSDYDPVVVEFDEADVVLSIRDADGNEITGESSADGNTVRWTVRGSHGTNTEYQVWGVKGDCEEQISTLTTGPWRFADLDGQTFELDFASAQGLGTTMINQIVEGGQGFGIWNQDGANDFWASVPLEDGRQYACLPTTSVTGGFVNSKLSLRLTDVPWAGDDDEPIRWVATELTGLVPTDDPSRMDRIKMVGELDFSALASEGASCEFFEQFGEECAPCSDGSGPICLRVDLTGATASAVSWSAIETDGVCSE